MARQKTKSIAIPFTKSGIAKAVSGPVGMYHDKNRNNLLRLVISKRKAVWKHAGHSMVRIGDVATMLASEAHAESDRRRRDASRVDRSSIPDAIKDAETAGEMLLCEAVERFRLRKIASNSHRPATIESWQGWSSQFSRSTLGRTKVKDVTPTLVEEHFDHRLKTAPGSVRNHLARLGAVTQNLVDKKVISECPVEFLRRTEHNEVQTKKTAADCAVKPDSVGQFLLDLEELSDVKLHYYLFFAMGIVTGLRPDTLSRIDIGDVEFREIEVKHGELERFDGINLDGVIRSTLLQGALTVRQHKTSGKEEKEIVLPLNSIACHYLQAAIADREIGPAFLTARGRRLVQGTKQYTRHIRKVTDKTIWRDWYPHSGRSTFKQIGYKLNIPTFLVDVLQLHELKGMKKHYYAPDFDQLADVTQQIGDFINNSYIGALESEQRKEAMQEHLAETGAAK